MIIRYVSCPADYASALRLHMRPRRAYYILGILISVIALLAIAHQIFFVSMTLSNIWVPVVFDLSVGYLIGYFYLYLPRRAKNFAVKQELLQNGSAIDVTPNYLMLINSDGEKTISWESFYGYKFGKDLVILYRSRTCFNLFPRKWFDSDFDFDLFKSYVIKNLKES